MYRYYLLLVLLVGVGGCVLAPDGTDEQRALVDELYERHLDPPELPPLLSDASFDDLLQRAFLVNGELIAAYWEWRAAVDRIDRAAGWPNSNVSVDFEYLLSGGQMKSWDRTTLTVGFDPMQNLSLPNKVVAAGRVALDDARAAAERFRATKFDIQRRVVDAYLDYALATELARLQRSTADLLAVRAAATTAQLQAGGAPQPLQQVLVQQAGIDVELAMIGSRLADARARLNALTARPGDAELAPPPMPGLRPLPASDADVVGAIVRNNPELNALTQMQASREHAVEAAELAWLPDINPFVGITGSATQVVGAAFTLATTFPQIRASIREAESGARAAQAMWQQGGRERAAAAWSTLAAVRASEAQVFIVDTRVLPTLQLSAATTRRAYESGASTLTDSVEAELAMVEAQSLRANAVVNRERGLAQLEAMGGFDSATLSTFATHAHAEETLP